MQESESCLVEEWFSTLESTRQGTNNEQGKQATTNQQLARSSKQQSTSNKQQTY